MDHGPAAKLDTDHASGKKAKIGSWLFIIYSIVYAGFVAIGVTNYELLGKTVLGEQNLAVVYGFGLIVFAIVLGLIYNIICTRLEKRMNKEDKS